MNEYGGGWCPFTLLARALESITIYRFLVAFLIEQKGGV